MQAFRSVGRRRSLPKELLGTVSAKRWYRWNWLTCLVTECDVDDRFLTVAVNGRAKEIGRSLFLCGTDKAGSRRSFLREFFDLTPTEEVLPIVLENS